MRILCIIPTMGPGGAERAMSYLTAHLSKRHTVTLLTLEKPNTRSFYPLSPAVEYLCVDKLGGHGLHRLCQILSRPIALRQTVRIRRPDLIISFMDTTNMTALAACLGLGIPIVISERIDTSKHRIGWAKELGRTYLYQLAYRIVVQTSRVASHFPASLQPKIRIIGNPIPFSAVAARPLVADRYGRLRIIAVGRYELQKGFDLLIEAFALIAGESPDWDLVIFGDGPERSRLEARVRQLGLEGRIWLKGTVSDVFQELAASHLMACPSRYEGFPNALAEGLAAGLPAVGYKGVSGVEELILDGTTGLLVAANKRVPGLARALSTLMADPRRRAKLGEAAHRHVGQWAPDCIFALWDNILEEACQEAPAECRS
jgi:glycosyltransferase involved in cell wall biosynthesis